MTRSRNGRRGRPSHNDRPDRVSKQIEHQRHRVRLKAALRTEEGREAAPTREPFYETYDAWSYD